MRMTAPAHIKLLCGLSLRYVVCIM
jgi:hypothetical protein